MLPVKPALLIEKDKMVLVATDQVILRFADQLMRPLKKYGNHKRGYNFSKAKTARQKAEVIQIWIGEILYEATKNQDPESLKSLITTILLEIEGLVEFKKNR